MTDLKLDPCKLCGGDAREVPADEFHLSFVVPDDDRDNGVEFNFLHFGGIQCERCGLLLPFHDTGENRLDNIALWNGELCEHDKRPDQECESCAHDRDSDGISDRERL
jgi:hypothetical protein